MNKSYIFTRLTKIVARMYFYNLNPVCSFCSKGKIAGAIFFVEFKQNVISSSDVMERSLSIIVLLSNADDKMKTQIQFEALKTLGQFNRASEQSLPEET